MPSDTSPEQIDGPNRAERDASGVLAWVAILALAGNCLLNSPSRFSEKHLADTSLLKPVVDALALWGKFPTARGVEIRNLVFYVGAAALALVAGVRLASARFRNRLSLDDLLEVRDRAASPYLWWIVLIAVSWLSSLFSHAPNVCQGQTISRMLHLAWWWPLAAMLTPGGVRTVASGLVMIGAVTSGVGLWYHAVRVLPDMPGARLQYPVGNELWLAACLLPALLAGIGLLAGAVRRAGPSPAPEHGGRSRYARPCVAVMVIALVVILGAIALTRSRSAAAGFVTGIFLIVAVLVPKRRRLAVVLGMLLLGIGGALLLQTWRSSGSTGLRAHSIRARLDYEWPYAIRLFFEKPIAGNGDGAYALLAGQFAREDQLDDPNVMRFDEQHFTAHAHNEFLELLSDIGLVGAGAFALALILPIYRAIQYCDRHRDEASGQVDRWMVLGLASALAAAVVEACGTPAIREPGAMPILLTVWACLWAMVRRELPQPANDAQTRPLADSTVRLFGVLVCVAALVLGYQGIQDWRAMRARQAADRLMAAGDYPAATEQADFASAHALDPFQQVVTGMISVWARSLYFDGALRQMTAPPGNDAMAFSSQAVARLKQVGLAAPRFLRLARLEADLEINRARAYERRAEAANAAYCQERFIQALRQARSDDPFLVERVEQLWLVDVRAPLESRLTWLCSLMRGGEVDARFVRMARQLSGMDGFAEAIGSALAHAREDAEITAEDWRDRLSPEACRLAALAEHLAGHGNEAQSLLDLAQKLYEKAGPRLFAGHAAAIHEQVRYRFAADPLGDVDANLERLAHAYSIAYAPATPDAVLHDAALGRTRAMILLAAGDESAARDQLSAISAAQSQQETPLLASVYLGLAESFLGDSRFTSHVIKWLKRVQELTPDSHVPDVLMAEIYLDREERVLALESIERVVGREGSPGVLQQLRERYPNAQVWSEVDRKYPGLLHDPTTTRPTTDAP